MKKDSRDTRSFSQAVHAVVRAIPQGEVRSYKEVASLAGSPRAYRAVATLMSRNYDPSIPCHRVIRSDGSVGDYNRGGATAKRALLIKEGFHFPQ